MVCPCKTIYKNYNYTAVGGYDSYIDIVYSDCGKKSSLDILLQRIDKPIRNIYAYTKCFKHSKYAFLKNKGRIDETYLYHIIKNYYNMSGFILFTKNTFYRDSKDLFLGNPTKSMKNLLSPNVSFGCLMSYPIWHSCKDLFRFNLYTYEKKYDTKKSTQTFKSKYSSFSDWMIDTSFRNFKTWKRKKNCPVCYGGSFLTHSDNIKKIPQVTWEKIHKSLMRGDNIEESHFMERYWAMLLTNPLDDKSDIKLNYATRNSILPPIWVTGIKSNCTCI